MPTVSSPSLVIDVKSGVKPSWLHAFKTGCVILKLSVVIATAGLDVLSSAVRSNQGGT
jgi:hypothetical protein